MSKTYKDLAESGLPVQSIINSNLDDKGKELGFKGRRILKREDGKITDPYREKMSSYIRQEFGLDEDFQINFKSDNRLTQGTKERIADAAISGNVEFKLGEQAVESTKANTRRINRGMKILRTANKRFGSTQPKKKYSDLGDEEAASALSGEIMTMTKEYPTREEIAYYVQKRFGIAAEFYDEETKKAKEQDEFYNQQNISNMHEILRVAQEQQLELLRSPSVSRGIERSRGMTMDR